LEKGVSIMVEKVKKVASILRTGGKQYLMWDRNCFKTPEKSPTTRSRRQNVAMKNEGKKIRGREKNRLWKKIRRPRP